MKLAFGSKRKARKIEVDDEDDEIVLKVAPESTEPLVTRTYTSFTVEYPADIECIAD